MTGIMCTMAGVTGNIAAPAGPSVVVAALKTISKLAFVGTCYAQVKVDSDGSLYENSSAGSSTADSAYEVWLDAGLNSEVWVQAVVTSGTLTNTAGSGRLACTSDRQWGISLATAGTKTTVVRLDFYDAASGGNLLDSQTVTLIADR